MARQFLIIIALLGLVGCAAQKDMIISAEDTAENKRVSDLTEISTAAAGTEEFFVNQSGSSRKITVDNVLKRLESELSSYAIAPENESTKIVGVVVVDDDTDVTVEDGAGDVLFRVPKFMDGWNLVDVEACHYVEGEGTGTQFTAISIYNTGLTQLTDMPVQVGTPTPLYSVLRIDEDELDSETAVINATYDDDQTSKIDPGKDDVKTGDQLRFDVQIVPTTTAPKGLYVEMHFQKP